MERESEALRKEARRLRKEDDVLAGRDCVPTWPGGRWRWTRDYSQCFGLKQGMRFRHKGGVLTILKIEYVHGPTPCTPDNPWLGTYVLDWCGDEKSFVFREHYPKTPDFVYCVDEFMENYEYVAEPYIADVTKSAARPDPRRAAPLSCDKGEFSR